MIPLLTILDDKIKEDERYAIEEGLKLFVKLFPDIKYKMFNSKYIIHKIKELRRTNRDKGFGFQIDVSNLNYSLKNEEDEEDEIYRKKKIDALLSGKVINIDKPKKKISFEKRTFNLLSKKGLPLIVLGEDIFFDNLNFAVGSASRKEYAVISPIRFRKLEKNLKELCIKIELWHETGHLFDAPPNERSDTVESLGTHDPDYEICVMRQGLSVPNDWIRFAEDYKKTGIIYCKQCRKSIEYSIKNFLKKIF